jgi:acetyl esterase/lipase
MTISTKRRLLMAVLAAGAAAAGTMSVRANRKDQRADGIPYGDHARQVLDVYAPEDDSATARPVVVYLYGGGWQGGQRKASRPIAQTLAAHGIVTFAPDYRVYPETVFPGFIEDAAAAVRWTHQHAHEFGGDPGRIIIMGHSAGAHIAAMVATAPQYLQADGLSKASLRGMVGLAGPYSQFTTDPHMAEIFPAALRPQAMPIDFVTGNEPPMLLAAGTADTDVDPVNSTQFADALRAKGDLVELKRYEGLGHDSLIQAFSTSQRDTSPVVADVLAFIQAQSAAR